MTSKSFQVYKFTCAICSSSYIGKTCRHFKTRTEEHIKDNKSYIFKHLRPTATCFDSYNSLCFKIIDKANSKIDLKIKETLHINWRKPNLNVQQNHLALTLFTTATVPCYSFLSLLFLRFLFHLLLSLSVTLIIDIFYCLNYILLLLHLIKTLLVSHLSLLSIVFIISMLIISICANYHLNYTLLLLHLIIAPLVIDFIITM